MAATPNAATDTELDDLESDVAAEPRRGRARRATNLRIVEDWKGMPALLDGDRLVSRSANVENLERMMAKASETGKRPFSSKVAPVDEPADDDLD